MKPLGDFHIHTIASSHAYSTMDEIIHYARQIGLEYVGIADHGPKMLDGPHPYYFSNLVVVPRKMEGVEFRKGIELNILDVDGNTDFNEEKFSKLDYAIASFHEPTSPLNLTADQYVEIYSKVVKQKYVKVIGHPGNPRFPVKAADFVAICRENKVAIEVNNSSFVHTREGSWPFCLAIVEEAARQKADVVMSSDAHIKYDVGNFAKALELIAKAGLPQNQIVNYNKDKIEFYFGGGTK